MTRTSNRVQRFSVMCAVAAVVSLGWSPLQALADDGAVDAVGATVAGATDQVADTVTATADPVEAVSASGSNTVEAVATTAADPIEAVADAASNTVGTVSDAASNTVGTVSDAASNTVGTVSDAASNTVGTVSDAASNTVSTVSGAASNTVSNVASNTVGTVSNVVGDTTAAVGGAAGSLASGALMGAGQANETVAATSSTSLPLFPTQQAASDPRSAGATRRSIDDDLVLLAERGRAAATLDNQGPGSCVSTVSFSCVTQTAGDAPGSWKGTVASVLKKLLALTGSGLLTWVVASCILTVMGALALHETKRRSEGYPLRSS